MVVVDSSCLCESVAPITMAPIEIRYILLCVGPATVASNGKGEGTVSQLKGDMSQQEGSTLYLYTKGSG